MKLVDFKEKDILSLKWVQFKYYTFKVPQKGTKTISATT